MRRRSAVGGGRRRVGDLSAAAGRVWRGRGRGRGRGGRVGDLSWRGRGMSWGSECCGSGFKISRYFWSG
jgi:hypothetical protein